MVGAFFVESLWEVAKICFIELLIEDTEGHLAHPDIVDVNRASGAVGVGNIEADLGGAGSLGDICTEANRMPRILREVVVDARRYQFDFLVVVGVERGKRQLARGTVLKWLEARDINKRINQDWASRERWCCAR